MIRKAVPEATEKAYPGWNGIGYRHPAAGYFCAIFPQDDKVKLGLEYGAFLPDPFRLLKAGPSGGRKVRYVEILAMHSLDRINIETLLQAAVLYRS